MDFEPYFKVHNLVSVYPRSIILDQMTNLNMIFHVLVSVYRLVKIWNSPQFPDEFRNSLVKHHLCWSGQSPGCMSDALLPWQLLCSQLTTGLCLRWRHILRYKDQLKLLLRKLELIRRHGIQQWKIDPACDNFLFHKDCHVWSRMKAQSLRETWRTTGFPSSKCDSLHI